MIHLYTSWKPQKTKGFSDVFMGFAFYMEIEAFI